MNDALKMQVSEFVDGELPANESELLLRRLSQDAELRQLVAHYFALGRVMRAEPAVPHVAELRGRIAAALGEEPQPVAAEPVAEQNRYIKPLAGFAIAASVALLAIFSLQGPAEQIPDAVDSVAGIEAVTVPPTSEQLDEFYRHHDEGASSNNFITELVTLDIDEAGLTEIEPQATFLSTSEVQTEIDEDEDEETADLEQAE